MLPLVFKCMASHLTLISKGHHLISDYLTKRKPWGKGISWAATCTDSWGLNASHLFQGIFRRKPLLSSQVMLASLKREQEPICSQTRLLEELLRALMAPWAGCFVPLVWCGCGMLVVWSGVCSRDILNKAGKETGFCAQALKGFDCFFHLLFARRAPTAYSRNFSSLKMLFYTQHSCHQGLLNTAKCLCRTETAWECFSQWVRLKVQ